MKADKVHIRLHVSLSLWEAVFSKYESFKANGTKFVSVDQVIADYEHCRDATKEPTEEAQRLIFPRRRINRKS
jgi:hypothetical protein